MNPFNMDPNAIVNPDLKTEWPGGCAGDPDKLVYNMRNFYTGERATLVMVRVGGKFDVPTKSDS